MTQSYRWPLAVSAFTLADKAKIAWWVLTNDRYTMGAKVAELERQFSEYAGAHALMVANGSVANQLVFELWKLRNPGIVPVVICPAVTWISSISPAMMAGMEVVFCDVNLIDFSFDYDMLERLIENHTSTGRRVILWPTALIGFSPEMQKLERLAKRYGADLYLDSCENTFSRMEMWVDACVNPNRREGEVPVYTRAIADLSILASADITTTSLYMSHQVCSIEGGFVFFRDKDEYDRARVFRNHGLTRSLPPTHDMRVLAETFNPDVDPQFLFMVPGTNLRPTDVHAMFGLQDLKRAPAAKLHRDQIYRQFHAELDMKRYYLPWPSESHIGFCLPIFTRGNNLRLIKQVLQENGIECRPIIGSHLGYQPCLSHLFEHPVAERYPNAEWIHRHGCYVGLHGDVSPAMVTELVAILNRAPLSA